MGLIRRHKWYLGYIWLLLILLIFTLSVRILYISLLGEMSYVEKVSESSTCQPRKNMVFAKIHKCASSTVQNILIRYGDENNLTFVLPKYSTYIGHPEHFKRSLLPATKNREQEYNLLVHHLRLNYKEIRLLMPSDTVFFTMLRDPVDLFESIFNYVNLDLLYGMNISEFTETAPNYRVPLLERRYGKQISGINQIAFDLGLKIDDFWSKNVVERFIHLLDDYFDLVMITERFHESVILLKDLLCLEIKDVTFFHLNKRPDRSRSNLNESQRKKLRRINGADQAIYDYFVKKFDRKVEAFGKERMKQEVETLKIKNSELFQKCVTGEEEAKALFIRGRNYGIYRPFLAYQVVQNEICQRMNEMEMITSDYLREKQKSLYLSV